MTVINIPGRQTVWQRELQRDGEDHYVYIIGQLDDRSEVRGPCKVGISNNPISRLSSLQTGNAGKLVLVGRYCFWRRSHALAVEQAFHKAMVTYRMQGECFDIEPDHAVGVMIENLKGFVDHFLKPDDTGDYMTAMTHIGVPGFAYAMLPQDFGYGS